MIVWDLFDFCAANIDMREYTVYLHEKCGNVNSWSTFDRHTAKTTDLNNLFRCSKDLWLEGQNREVIPLGRIARDFHRSFVEWHFSSTTRPYQREHSILWHGRRRSPSFQLPRVTSHNSIIMAVKKNHRIDIFTQTNEKKSSGNESMCKHSASAKGLVRVRIIRLEIEKVFGFVH